MLRFYLLLILAFAFAQYAHAHIWHVGPSQTYTKPSQVSNLVQNNDTILIDAGNYPNDVARWTAHNLLFRGMGGLAHLKCGGNVYGGKAIWVIVGNDATVENIEFSEATCPDLNGAGIRSEGVNLTIRGCYFHNNEDGILAGDISSGDILIEHCEFSSNGHSNGLAHNLYINHAHSLTFRYNYSHDAKVGHELKSRAYNNFIYCNRFSDENGTSSRSMDLPNGGFTILMGNLIVQDQFSENSNIVGYGLEGLSNPNSELYVVFNTFINNKNTGSFLQIANGAPLLKAYDNIFGGPGTIISGATTVLDTMSNRVAPIVTFGFTDPAAYDYSIGAGSVAAGVATNPGTVGVYPLNPSAEYVHPEGFKTRATTLDAGAFAVPVASGLPELASASLSIYPDPVHDFLAIKGLKEPLTGTICDTAGKIWLKNALSNQLDVHKLPAGMYWLTLVTAGKTRTLPFIKQ